MITSKDTENLPSQPGVYIFSLNSVPIYIGKSVDIKTRVKSHIAQSILSKKEHAIVSQADEITYVTTLSNFDALLLEADLIRKHMPKYNVLWKDDKHYLYIKITIKDACPKIYPVRKENDQKSLYFGPFGSTQMTNSLIYELRHIIPFCTNPHTSKRPCFYSRIGLCNPCPNYIESIDNLEMKKSLQKKYRQNCLKVIGILSGKSHVFITALEKKLKKLADEKRYEEAIPIRNRLFKLTLFLERRAFKRSEYTNIDVSKLETEILNFLGNTFSKNVQNRTYRIECFDISNLFGEEPTGSMVVFQDSEFSKKEYRKFAVKRKGISDVHMMREVLSRRLMHSEWRVPDLIILDGGRPQLRMIYEYFLSQNITIPLISIAKRPDRILTPANNYKPIHIDRYSLLFKLFQSLRDESHRFAKKYHVMLRNRNLLN